MRHSQPYLHRRGFGLTFRIAVPADLRTLLGIREITKALPTANRHEAVPLALSLAHQAKALFFRLRLRMKMPNCSNSDLVEQGYTLELVLDGFGRPTGVKADVDVWLGGTVQEASKLVRLAPVEIFEAGPAM